MLNRERIKLSDQHRGIKDMRRLPDAVIVVDARLEFTAVKEANGLGIPIIAIVDSNTNPNNISYPIPANDDSIRTIQLLISSIADTILEANGKLNDNNTPTDQSNISDADNKQDSIDDNIIATTYPDEWDVALYQSSSCSSSFSGSIGAGQSKYLYLCAAPDQDSDIGNYSVLTEFSPNSGIDPAVQVSVNLEVASPRRELDATAIDSSKEIYPEYEGSITQNLSLIHI